MPGKPEISRFIYVLAVLAVVIVAGVVWSGSDQRQGPSPALPRDTAFADTDPAMVELTQRLPVAPKEDQSFAAVAPDAANVPAASTLDSFHTPASQLPAVPRENLSFPMAQEPPNPALQVAPEASPGGVDGTRPVRDLFGDLASTDSVDSTGSPPADASAQDLPNAPISGARAGDPGGLRAASAPEWNARPAD